MNEPWTSTVPTLPTLDRALACAPELQSRTDVQVPPPELLALPEKAVQFGTGALLRGFVEYFLDEANRQGRFGGRVVMVGSTGSGRDRILAEQDGLYTLSMRGLEAGAPRETHRVIGVVSRALAAGREWDEVLACARNPELELVFSNTTEVGIALDEADDPLASPPRSFPGKLTRFLLERGRAFGYDPARGLVVIPCELIEDNGDRLRAIVLALAARAGLEEAFADWLRSSVIFCNTLVDRIVPGTPEDAERERLERRLGYRDGLLTVSEIYRLFAIEGDDALRERLRFADADRGIVVTDDVTPYRERKVRLLNGTHTVTVAAALLAGCETVAEAVGHPLLGAFVRRTMLEEIVPSLDVPGAEEFARAVLDRFANPFIRHALVDITLQGTMKMRVRVVPSILGFAAKRGTAPPGLALGFAAYLLFMRGDLLARRRAAGLPVPADDAAYRVRALWEDLGEPSPLRLARLAYDACAIDSLWGCDLTRVPGFVEAVSEHLQRMASGGVEAALRHHLDRERASSETAASFDSTRTRA